MSHQPAAIRAGRFRPWFVAGILFSAAVTFSIMLRWDVALMRWRDDVMPARPTGTLEQILIGFRNAGQVLSVLIAICIAAAYDRRRKTVILSFLLAQAAAAIGYNSVKYTVARHRPTQVAAHVAPMETPKPARSWIGWRPGNTSYDTQSFPSGHSAAAFALAGVLAYFYPRLGWMFWVLASGCALTRFLEAFHWPSDCFIGAIIGFAAARIGCQLAIRCFRTHPSQTE